MAKLQNPSAARPSSGRLFFSPPVLGTDYLPTGQCLETVWEWPSLQPTGGSPSLRWMPGASARLWGPGMRAAGAWGRAGAGERTWNTLRHQQEQLVNLVGVHLVERRCINIRSLSAYCVSQLGGGGAGRPQMPFVKKTRMASRSPRKVAACPRAVLRFRAQILGRAE